MGDRVRIGTTGESVFAVVEVPDAEHTVIESVEDAAGRYPFEMRAVDLVRINPDTSTAP
ncbi:hypothetical protein AB0H49_33855 [Nocardia sp. NPDC050713]|uniref:hypothetical protein n=1 Tax=Nocardia sp. NPDC050713 TaxID=3154511 RepID=UPI0033CCE94D